MNGTADDSTILMVRFSPSEKYELIVEDNGRVAYAYMRENGKIVADVWLYNCVDAPAEPEWRDRSLAPFANPVGFCAANDLGRLTTEGDLKVEWHEDEAVIFVHGIRWATLRSGEKPGKCRLATSDGPLARRLGEEIA